MATVLERREFDQDGISFVLLTGLRATAIAVDAPPGVAVSEIATRLVQRLTEDGVLGDGVMIGLAFRGAEEPDAEATEALIESCCYAAVKDLQDSAVANAEGFLEEVESAVPGALAIATFRRIEAYAVESREPASGNTRAALSAHRLLSCDEDNHQDDCQAAQ